jgi:hypothetical protein
MMLSTEVARRLEACFGLGQFPMIRRRLYARLQRLCVSKGEAVLVIVGQVVEEAKAPSIRDHGKWFSAAVVRRLTEAGLWTDEPTQAAKAADVRQLAGTLGGQAGRVGDELDRGGAPQWTPQMQAGLDAQRAKLRDLAAREKGGGS